MTRNPSNFGHIVFAPKPRVVTSSFWIDADRQDFTATCHAEWETRMRGSEGEKLVGAVPIVGMTKEDRAKAKGRAW